MLRISQVSMLIVSMFLTGCSTEAWERYNRQQAENQRRFQMERDASLEKQCSGYGFLPGTPAMANCKMQADISQQRAWEADAARRAQKKEQDMQECLRRYDKSQCW